MKCRRCGSEIRPGSKICSDCGTSVSRRRQAGSVVCRHCGRRVRASGSLCPACGAELRRSWLPLVKVVLALALVGAGYYVVTQVVTLPRIQQQVERLRNVSLVALLPQPTPTVASLPTRATEVRPTPTRIPTMTPTVASTPTAMPTPAETMTPSPTTAPTKRPPTPVPAPAFPYEAVKLAAPATGTEFAGADAPIRLSWESLGALGEGEGYAVTLRYQVNGEPKTTVAWVQETSWRVPAEVYAQRDAASPVLEWSVRVTKGASDGANLSPASATWTFIWR